MLVHNVQKEVERPAIKLETVSSAQTVETPTEKPQPVEEKPEIEPIIIEKPGVEVGYGAIGIGEITSIPTAPAVAGAYYKWSGEFQTKLPLANTPYERKKKAVK